MECGAPGMVLSRLLDLFPYGTILRCALKAMAPWQLRFRSGFYSYTGSTRMSLTMFVLSTFEAYKAYS